MNCSLEIHLKYKIIYNARKYHKILIKILSVRPNFPRCSQYQWYSLNHFEQTATINFLSIDSIFLFSHLLIQFRSIAASLLFCCSDSIGEAFASNENFSFTRFHCFFFWSNYRSLSSFTVLFLFEIVNIGHS